MKKFLLLSAAFVLMAVTAIAQGSSQQWWGYVQDNGARYSLGTGTATTYNVAIGVDGTNSAMAGNTIKALRFYLRSVNDIRTVKVWISKQLPASADKADIVVENVNINSLVGGDEGSDYPGKANVVELTAPYTVNASKFYVGYSFSVKSIANATGQNPLVLSDENGGPESFYMMTGSGEWSSYANTYGPIDLRLLLEGSFAQNAAKANDVSEAYATMDRDNTVDITLVNGGLAGVSSFDYTITANGTASAEQHIDLQQPITAFGGTAMVQIPIVPGSKCGTQQQTLTITKVNGQANEAATATSTIALTTLLKSVTRGVAMEQYTGTGCGWCPRGHVGMGKMRQMFGNAFVGIAIHRYSGLSADAMYISTYTQPTFNGAPSCRVNRGEIIDPYYGSANDITDDISAALAQPAKAGLNVSGLWNTDSTKITVTAEVEALIDGNYKLDLVLIADSLQGTANVWRQANYYDQSYASQTGVTLASLPDDLKFLWSAGGTFYPVFNDVAIAVTKNISVGKMTAGKVTTKSSTLAMPSGNRTELLNAINRVGKNHVAAVALLIDNSTGRIVNAAKTYMPVYVPVENGIEEMPAYADGVAPAPVARFGTDGRLLSSPQRGLNIVRRADGTTRKVMVR